MGEGSTCGSSTPRIGNEISYTFKGGMEKGSEIMGRLD